MNPRELRLELLRRLSVLQGLRSPSADFENLVASGVDRPSLSSFVDRGCRRKSVGASRRPAGETSALVSKLVASGGVVAGGAALRKWLYADVPGDTDVFFNDFPSYVSAHLAAQDDLSIDVCLYRRAPYELFDLGISKCSFGSSEFDLDPSCEEALRTGVSDVALGSVVDARATLRRIAKYGARWGTRFDMSQVLTLCAAWRVDDQSAVDGALAFAV